MFYTAILLLLTAAVARGNITGQHPHAGKCLCLSGTGVNARDKPGLLGTHVIATVNTGECYKFHGGILTKDGYTWYQLQHVNGHNPWVAGNFLNTGTTSQCSGSSSGSTSCSATAKNLACDLLARNNNKSIALWNIHPSGRHDNAYALNNIWDTCHGHAASRSHYLCSLCSSPAPGGSVCLSTTLLRYLHTLASKGYIHVNELAGACHTCGSKHYLGRAVDLHNDSRSAEMLKLCFAMGGWGQDEGNHIHCQFPS